MVAHADEVLVYKLSLANVPGLFAISTFNPNEDLFTMSECAAKAEEIKKALRLDIAPACIREIAVRQQG